MAKILALDTSTDACSVALWLDGEVIGDFRVIPRQHTKELLPMVSTLLAGAQLSVAQLDAIAFGRGPGSFAGIRIATGTAQGLAFAAELPLLPVSTLAAMALKVHQQSNSSRVVASLDARMNEIYAAAYHCKDGAVEEVLAERVCAPADLVLPEDQWTAVGPGFNYRQDMAEQTQQRLAELDKSVYPTAGAMVQLAIQDFDNGKVVAPELAMPVYLRDDSGWKKKDQQ